MKTENRRRELVAVLRESGTLSVEQLSNRFGVSLATIRRDLTALSQSGAIVRFHGGAETPVGFEPSWESRVGSAIVEKRAIAQLTAELLQPGDVVAVDSGTTPYEVVRVAIETGTAPLSLLTGSVAIASLAAGSSQDELTVIMPGGVLRNTSQLLIGEEDQLNAYHCDKAILSCTGLDLAKGAMHTNLLAGPLKRKLAEISETVILVADHTKMNRSALAVFADFDQISILVTDWRTPKDVIAKLRTAGVEVLVAPPPRPASATRVMGGR